MTQDSTKIFHYFARWFLAIRSAGDFISLISDLPLSQNTPHRCLFHFPGSIISPHWCLVLCFIYFHWGFNISLSLSHTPFNSRQPPLWNSHPQEHIFPWTYSDSIFIPPLPPPCSSTTETLHVDSIYFHFILDLMEGKHFHASFTCSSLKMTFLERLVLHYLLNDEYTWPCGGTC